MENFSRNAVWIIPVIYFFIAIGGSKLSDNGEIFPFFHWGLYSQIPQDISKLELYIQNKKGKTVNLYDTIEHQVDKVTYYNMLENFVSHISLKQQSQYLAKILTYLPETHHLVVKKITVNDTLVLGVIKNKTFTKQIKQ